MSDVALVDALSPYFFAGVDVGSGISNLLDGLRIDERDVAWDEDGVVLWSVARIDSVNSFFSPNRGTDDQQLWQVVDIALRLRLTVSRQATNVLEDVATPGSNLRKLLVALGSGSPGSPSDYPGTQFRLELLANLITLRIPELRGAKLEPNGLLT